MKLNRRRLRQLIKEELEILNEDRDAAIEYLTMATLPNSDDMRTFIDHLSDMLNEHFNASSKTINGLPGDIAVITLALNKMRRADGKTVVTKFRDKGEMQAIGDDPDFYNAPPKR